MKHRPPTLHRQSGLSYVELLITAVIIGLSVMPISSALQSAMQVTDADIDATANHYRLVATLEELLSKPFSTLSAQALGPATPSAYSDPVASADRRLVFIAAYDGDNADADDDPFTGTDAGLLWIRVELEGTVRSLAVLKADL